METTTLQNDLLVYCVTASSFPEGVKQAHETLHSLAPFDEKRKYFGLSRPAADGRILYQAAAAELHQAEFSKHHLETEVISKGEYLYIDVHDYMKDIPAIGNAFQQLIHDSRIDPNGFCIEWYMGMNVCRCMVRMAS
jgi:hypothetical protein